MGIHFSTTIYFSAMSTGFSITLSHTHVPRALVQISNLYTRLCTLNTDFSSTISNSSVPRSEVSVPRFHTFQYHDHRFHFHSVIHFSSKSCGFRSKVSHTLLPRALISVTHFHILQHHGPFQNSVFEAVESETLPQW